MVRGRGGETRIEHMIFSNLINDLIGLILIAIMAFFLMFDTILIYIIRHRKPLLKNQYFDFHRRHGFHKVTFYKIMAAIAISHLLIINQAGSGGLAVPITAHGIYVIKLLIDFLKNKQENHIRA